MKTADRKVNRLFKHLPVPAPVRGALGRVKARAITHAKHAVASAVHRHIPHIPRIRHRRRELEDDEDLSRRDLDDEELSRRDFDDEELSRRDLDDEELSRRDLDDEELSLRDLDAEELFDREYYDDDFLVERDDFDDLD